MPTEIITLLALVASYGASVGALVWKLSRVELALRAEIHSTREDADTRHDTHTRLIGETIAALRQKITDVELDAYKTFVRRDSFFQMQQKTAEEMKAQFDRIDARFDKLEAKLDARPPRPV